MSDARWIEVTREAALAAEYLGNSVELYGRDFNGQSIDAFAARMAFMHAVQSGYTSLESALARIFEMLDEPRPSGDHWHRQLVARACLPVSGENARPAILSPEMCEMVDEARRFRNLATRAYDTFSKDKAAKTVAAARFISEHLAAEIAEFKRVIDPD